MWKLFPVATAPDAAPSSVGANERAWLDREFRNLRFHLVGLTNSLANRAWQPVVTSATATPVNVNTSAAETTLHTVTLPRNGANVESKLLTWTSRGFYGTLNPGPGTLTFRLKWGSTTIATTGAIALTAGLTSQPWSLMADTVVVTAGSSGTVRCNGSAVLQVGAGAVYHAETTNTATVTVDTTAVVTLSLTAQFSVSNAANTLTIEMSHLRAGAPL